MKIRKIIRNLIKEALINESEKISNYGTSKLKPDSFSFSVTNGSLAGWTFSQEKRETPADYAIQEKDTWNDRHDNNPECVDLLKKYWGSYYGPNDYWTTHNSENPNMHTCQNHPEGSRQTYHPWSAAFVRWCMQQSGRKEFNSINHIPFFIDAYKNRVNFIKNSNSLGSGKYFLFFINELDQSDIVKGDNGLFFRDGSNQDSSSAMQWFDANKNNRGVVVDTHSDICIGEGKCIGGNVGDTGTVGERDIEGRWVAVVKFVNGCQYESDSFPVSYPDDEEINLEDTGESDDSDEFSESEI